MKPSHCDASLNQAGTKFTQTDPSATIYSLGLTVFRDIPIRKPMLTLMEGWNL